MDASNVTKIDRRSVCRLCEHRRVDVGERPKFARLLERQLAPFRVHGSGGQGRVAALQDCSDRCWNDAEGGQSVLRIARLDLLLNHANPRDTGGFGRDFDRLLDEIGKIIELTVRIFRTGLALQNVHERNVGADDDRIPHIRMDVGSLRQLFPHQTDRASERADLGTRREPDHHETVTVNHSDIRSQALPDQGIAQQARCLAHERRIG